MTEARRLRPAIAHGELPWQWWGRVAYGPAVELLEAQRQKLCDGQDGARLFLCEHEPVVTLGRSAGEGEYSDRQALVSDDVAICRTSRGGLATYHGPGQLMVYPVVRLTRGIVHYLESLAAALSTLVEALGVHGAAWQRCPAGLWRGQKKLAACGLHVSRGIAIHGFALNIATPRTAWQNFSPCGLGEGAITSVAEELGAAPTISMEEIAGMAAPLIQKQLLGDSI